MSKERNDHDLPKGLAAHLRPAAGSESERIKSSHDMSRLDAAKAYMTPDAKAEEMREFMERRREDRPAGNLAGRGYPDPEILPYCDEINKLPGVCTLQSCAGHGGGGGPGGGDGAYTGNLWLWMDGATGAAMDAQAMTLEESPLFESVSKLYRCGRVIWDISFQANEHEPSRLEESMAVLLPFLPALCAPPPSAPQQPSGDVRKLLTEIADAAQIQGESVGATWLAGKVREAIAALSIEPSGDVLRKALECVVEEGEIGLLSRDAWERARAALAAQPSPPASAEWSKELPTEAGWYWFNTKDYTNALYVAGPQQAQTVKVRCEKRNGGPMLWLRIPEPVAPPEVT